jgi:hypothetical protein
LEEPENGIHPERMDAMMELLDDMAVDPTEAVGEDNPLRQIIVSTHSPVVTARVRKEQLVFADHRDAPGYPPGKRQSLVMRPIMGTWRDRADVLPVAQGEILGYLNTLRPSQRERDDPETTVFEYAEQQLALSFES